MMFSLFALTRQFVVQGLFGLWIIVHRILNGKHFETIVALKLGKSFSSIVYLLVVVCEEKNTFNTIYILYMNAMHVLFAQNLRNVAGFMHDDSHCSHLFFRSTFLFSCPSHKKGDLSCA